MARVNRGRRIYIDIVSSTLSSRERLVIARGDSGFIMSNTNTCGNREEKWFLTDL